MEGKSRESMSRRTWVARGGAGLAALLAVTKLPAQETGLERDLQTISNLTGSKLEEQWARPTAALVSVILDDSRSLRSLDLGEIEPATAFWVR